MPALLLALGSAFSWLVGAIVAGFTSAATLKLIRFGVAALMLPIALGWLTQHLGGASPFDIAGLLGTWLGGFPAFLLSSLETLGFVAFAFIILKIEVGAFVVSMLMRAFGFGR
jgi:hypothetical protein